MLHHEDEESIDESQQSRKTKNQGMKLLPWWPILWEQWAARAQPYITEIIRD